MAININSEAFCRKAYLNYHCYGNTMGISAEEMGKITQAWSDRLSSWQATVSSDENEYEFDDSEYAKYKSEGEQAGKDATGYDGGKGGMVARGVADATGSLVGAAAGVAANAVFKEGFKFAAKSIAKEGGKLVIKEGAKTGAKEAGKNALAKNASWSIAAPLALAVAVAYMAKKPNQDQKEACDALQTEMTGAQATLTDTQGEMEMMGEEIIALSDEATYLNEDANEEIEEQKSEYDMYYETLMAIQEKIDAGEPLTDSEKELYKEVVGYLTEIGVLIEEESSDTTDEVADLYDEMGTYQEGYDVAAETMGEIEGLTDYAESFDETTRTMCYVEAAAQTINAASGIKAGIKAGLAAAASLGFNAWAWACAAMGASAGVMSGIAAGQQFKWAGEVGTEIDMRKMTQDINTDTMDMYSEEIDAYDGWMSGVEDLELEIPDDIAPPEDTGLPETEPEPTGEEAVPETLKPKKEDEEDKK